VPVGTVVSSGVIWNYLSYCENTPFLGRNLFNQVPACLKA
ncbi:hypothetical protein N340_06595, partial [Tauraco erythrolophus]